jgi:hypothetical protein
MDRLIRVILASGAIIGAGGCAVFKRALGTVVSIAPSGQLAEENER